MQNRPDSDADTCRRAVSEITDFGAIVLAVSAALFVALLCMRLADRISLPYAALILVVTALAAAAWTDLRSAVSVEEVERIAVVALVVILFDGGLHIGAARFRRSVGPILALGVIGTFCHGGHRCARRATRSASAGSRRARRCRHRADRSRRHLLRLLGA